MTTPRCAPRRLGGAHTFFPVLNTPTKTPQPRCHAGDQRVTMPALCLDEMRVHLFSQGKSGSANGLTNMLTLFKDGVINEDKKAKTDQHSAPSKPSELATVESEAEAIGVDLAAASNAMN